MARKQRQDDDDRTSSEKGKADAPAKSGTLLLLLAGAGALLLCCTCGGVGTGGWFLRDKLGFGGPAAKKAEEQANAGGQKKEDPALGKWKEVRAEVGKFVVDLPANSVGDKSPVSGIGDKFVQCGGQVKNHIIAVSSTKRFGFEAKGTAKDVAEHNAQVPNFKNKKAITLQGHPGVERRSDDGRSLWRCYATDKRIYIISIMTQGAAFDQAVADRVFDSFKILE